jgi:hypothetical protein
MTDRSHIGSAGGCCGEQGGAETAEGERISAFDHVCVRRSIPRRNRANDHAHGPKQKTPKSSVKSTIYKK